MHYYAIIHHKDGSKSTVSGSIPGRGGMETRVSRSTAYRWAKQVRERFGSTVTVEPD